MREVMMARLSWQAYAARLAAGATLFVPIGALEQHGPHLPLGVDALLATDVAVDVARRVDGLVAAPINYGYKSQARCGGGQCFPGTTSLDGGTLVALVVDVLRELARHGARSVVLVDGHYENQWFLTEACELALREPGARESGLRLLRTEYWEFCGADVLDPMFPGGFPGFALEHAALIETSMMLHLHPELVRMDLVPDDGPASFECYDVYPQDGRGVPPSGVLASARGASAEHGRTIFEAICAGLAAAVRREFGGPAGP
jgi:creatinine amidohydrolase